MIKEIWKSAVNRFHSQGEMQFRKGMEKYGVPLVSFNGRNPFQDALEELFDLSQYLEQARCESETVAKLFYVYAITEGFFDSLPEHIKLYLTRVVDGQKIAEICAQEGFDFYGTAKTYGSKTL